MARTSKPPPSTALQPAGYSGTPLPKKLGIKEASRVMIVDGPAGFALVDLPTGAVIDVASSARSRPGKTPQLAYDVVLAFVTRRIDLVDRIAAWRPRMQLAGGLWIAWPKKASGVATDIVEGTIREVALPTGLVDNKVCAIDDTWSGLRLVIRRELGRTRRRASAR